MFENLWWVYVTIGILLIVIEIFTPGFIIMWFGISSIIAAIPVYFGATTKIVILTYAISLLILTTLIRKITLNYFSKSSKEVKTNISGITGSIGIAIEEINPVTSTGRVRIRKEVWTAISENEEVILANERIIVSKVDGVKLIVKKEEI